MKKIWVNPGFLSDKAMHVNSEDIQKKAPERQKEGKTTQGLGEKSHV